MKKIAVLGSCLSTSVAKELVSMGYQLASALHHIRLDAFSEFLSDETALGASPDILSWIFERAKKPGNGDKVEKLNKRLRNRLLEQTTNKLNDFKSAIQSADILLVDNNYDLSLPLTKFDMGVAKPVVLNAGESPEGGTYLGLMKIDGAANVYCELVSRLKKVNMDLVVVFLNYPVSGFEVASRCPLRHSPPETIRAAIAETHDVVDGYYLAYPKIKGEVCKYCTPEILDSVIKAIKNSH